METALEVHLARAAGGACLHNLPAVVEPVRAHRRPELRDVLRIRLERYEPGVGKAPERIQAEAPDVPPQVKHSDRTGKAAQQPLSTLRQLVDSKREDLLDDPNVKQWMPHVHHKPRVTQAVASNQTGIPELIAEEAR